MNIAKQRKGKIEMCVAIYKPMGATVDRETLRACFYANPHGAGFAWFDGKQTHLSKGYFAFDAWADEIAKIPAHAPALIHARIATHGATCPANCHPFIVSQNPKLLEKQHGKIKYGYVAVHNGIIGGVRPRNYADIRHSDTMQFIAQFLAPLARKTDITDGIGHAVVERLIEQSRFAVMKSNTGRVTLYGKWYKDTKTGVYFSNMAWKPCGYYYTYENGQQCLNFW